MTRNSEPYLLAPENKLDRVAFFGPMTAGKTTAANILVQDFGYTKFAFAEKLKDVVSDLFDINVSAKDGLTRQILQEFSTACKKWRPDIWIDKLLEEVAKSSMYGIDRVVIDDLRYIHEADVLCKNGFILILVDTPESLRMERVTKLYPDTDPKAHEHDSEQEWRSIVADFIISGEGKKTTEDIDDIFMFHKGV